MKFGDVIVPRVRAVVSFASFDAEILRFAQDDKKAPPLHSGDGTTLRCERAQRTTSRCEARICDRAVFLRRRRLKPTLLRRIRCASYIQEVIRAEMWYLFSFEQRPASQLAVPLGGTQ